MSSSIPSFFDMTLSLTIGKEGGNKLKIGIKKGIK